MRKLYAISLLIFMAMFVNAAPPTANLPQQVEANTGRIVVLDPKATEAKGYLWQVMYGIDTNGKFVNLKNIDMVQVSDGKIVVFASNIEGTYRIVLTLWNQDGISQSECIITLKVDDKNKPGPKPEPKPEPNPDPPSPIKVSKIYVAILKNVSAITPEQSLIMGDTKFWDTTIGNSTGSDWDFYSSNSKEADERGYIAQAKKLPENANGINVITMVILNAEDGKVLKVVKMPPTKDEIEKLIKEVKK